MSQLPRTPRYFPKMKVRGRWRRMRAPYQRYQRGIDIFGTSLRNLGKVAVLVTANMDAWNAAMRHAMEITEQASTKEGTQ
jgi:hypothetical protein